MEYIPAVKMVVRGRGEKYSVIDEAKVIACLKHDKAHPEAIANWKVFQPEINDNFVLINNTLFEVRMLDFDWESLGDSKTWPNGEDWYKVHNMIRLDELVIGNLEAKRTRFKRIVTPIENEDHRGLDEYDPLWIEDRPLPIKEKQVCNNQIDLTIPGHFLSVYDRVLINNIAFEVLYVNGPIITVDFDPVILEEETLYPLRRGRAKCIDWRESYYDGEDW